MSMLLSLTNYAYEAAGRMIKEGNKTYEYGWLDKALKVTENGKTLADFEYHNNGQIAKAIRPDKTENFLWDGLALVKRDDTKFINEPHTGGGNPVLAIQDVDQSPLLIREVMILVQLFGQWEVELHIGMEIYGIIKLYRMVLEVFICVSLTKKWRNNKCGDFFTSLYL